MRVTVALRLAGLALVGTATVGVMATAAIVSSNGQAADARSMAATSAAMSRQWNADMMHDALRADVLGSLAASGAADRKAFGVDEAGDHADTMRQSLGEAAKGAPASLQAKYRDAITQTASYTALSVDLVKLAGTDRQAALAKLPAFMAAFSSLEDLMGDIDAGMEQAVRSGNDQVEASVVRSRTIIASAFLVGILLLGGLSLLIVRSVTGPVALMRQRLATVAGGDFTVTTDTGRTDEIGDLARSIDGTLTSVRDAFSVMADCAGELTDQAGGLRAASAELTSAAEQTSEYAGRSVELATRVAHDAGEVARGIDSVSSQTRDISSSAANAAQVGRRAMDGANDAAGAIMRLGDSSAQISGVASMIRSISDQTRLLALNATIEAARAGEAGRGFAVVANEVKDLAQEVGRATEDISSRIAAIQQEVQDAVHGIEVVTGVIAEINTHQSDISDAVHRQADSSGDVASRIAGAARDAATIAETVTTISAAAEETSATAGVTLGSAARLQQAAARMTAVLDRYSF